MANGVVEWVLKLVNQVSGPAAAASVSVRALTPATTAATVGVAKLGAAFGPIGGILARVSPELGAMGATIAGLTSASGTAAAGLGISAGAMGVAFGAVVAAAAPFIGALVVMQREEAEAAARTAFLAAHLHDLDAAYRALADAQIAAAVAAGELSEAEGKALTLANQSTRSIEDFAKAQEKEVAAAGEAYFAAERRKEQLEMLPGFLATAIDYYGGYTSAMSESSRTLADLARIEGEHTDTIMDAEEARLKEADATDKARKAADAKADADRSAKADADALTKSIEAQTAAYQKWIAEFNAGKIGTVSESTKKKGLDLGQKLRDTAEIGAFVSETKTAIANTEFSWGMKEEAEEAAGLFARTMDRLGSAASTGGVVSAIGNSGPIGAIIVGVMTAITNLDETLSGLGDFVADFRKSLKDAPKEFADFLIKELGRGDKMVGAIMGFVQGLIDNMPRIMEALAGSIGPLTGALVGALIDGVPKMAADFIVTVFDPQTWIDAGKALLEGFASGFKDIIKPEAAMVSTPTPSTGNLFADIAAGRGLFTPAGSHADGADYVDKTGLYMLHRGERVDTASRTQRESGGSASGGGSGRMVGRGGKVYIEIDADSLSDTFGGLRGRGYAL